MEYFKKYVSNTLGGSGNQHCFKPVDENEVQTGRIFYKIFSGGKYNYSFLFSNIVDMTFEDTHANMIIDSWDIVSARVGKCARCSEVSFEEPKNFFEITFGGQKSKTVMPGEFFCTDAIELEFNKDEYICIEISFKGSFIPYHHEIILPVFRLENGEWKPSKEIPVPCMVGCDRKVIKRVGFFGDSITQGIGTEINSYLHWNARCAELLGENYSYWNLGIGCGTAADAASDGAWLFKVKQLDFVVLCFGVNDLHNVNRNEELLEKDIIKLVSVLHSAGVKVLVQTVPPFDYKDKMIEKWENTNTFIKDVVSKEADGIFDVVPILALDKDKPYIASFGGHPDSEGCKRWADELYPVLKKNIEKGEINNGK